MRLGDLVIASLNLLGVIVLTVTLVKRRNTGESYHWHCFAAASATITIVLAVKGAPYTVDAWVSTLTVVFALLGLRRGTRT